MDDNRQVDIATLLDSIASQLQQNQGQLNNVDNAGTHGQRIADAFTAAANAAKNTGTNDAGAQLMQAAQAMQQQGQGKAVTYYSQGLARAAKQFQGQSGISMGDLAPFLQAFLGGVKKNNPAKPGQGTMIDALSPAVNAYVQSQKSGADPEQGMAQALGAAIKGTASTGQQGNVDPGAASATNVLGGIFMALAPSLLNMLMNRGSQGAQAQGQGGGIDLGGLLGGLMGGAGASAGAQGSQGGGIDLGGLLGGLVGGGSANTGSQGTQDSGQLGWLGGLLGGMAKNAGGSGSSSGGVDLGGLFGGLMGGGASDSAGSLGQGARGSLDIGYLPMIPPTIL
jgi:hypothetical protein